MEFTPVRCEEAAYAEYVRLFADCFPGVDKFSRDYLDWLYRCNPDGKVVGFDARDGNRLAAHYVCIPARAKIGNEEVPVLLSLNTATHPDYQGQGLFTKLAELTFAAGTELGYDSVYGVANANSTPGFTRKLGFQLVGPLQASVGIGPVGIRFPQDTSSLQFRRIWSAQALAWRCACPVNPVRAQAGRGRTTLLASVPGIALMAVAEVDIVAPEEKQSAPISPLRLFLGQVPSAWQRRALYMSIPKRLRPSPLNLIYRSLTGRIKAIDPDAVFLGFIDFDAY